MSDFDFVIMDPYVHIMSAFPQLLFSKLKKAKTILDMRSIPVELKGLRGVMFTFWFNLSIQVAKRFFDGMTILTPLMKKEISKSYEIAPSKIGVWSSGVDTELFNAEKHASQGLSLKRELGLSQKFVVFYHGILTATRGTEEAVQSMAIISKKYPSIVLFLLGNGSAIPKLKTIIKKEALEQNVIIHEAVEYQEVPKFISMSDICLVPLPNHRYWRSQSPLKLLEYLSMEKVVILTDMAAHRYIVGDESCGIYIPSNEPMEIVKAIEFAFENRITLEERGKIGREIVNKQYSWSRIAESLENYLRSIEN
jgi:glycosyltransferase involved in cell wall biosynthesis